MGKRTRESGRLLPETRESLCKRALSADGSPGNPQLGLGSFCV